MTDLPKFVIVMEKNSIVEIYSNTEMEYAIVNYDEPSPVEGVWATVNLTCDLKELWSPRHTDQKKELKLFRRIITKLSRLKF